MKFYAACLASYNNGILHGAWIDAESDADSMQEQINAMLRASPFPNVTVEHPETGETVPSAEEYAIHDYDDMPASLGEYPDLQVIADYVEFTEACDEYTDDGKALAMGMLENWHSVDAAKEALDNFSGIYDSFRDYADECADEMIACYVADNQSHQSLFNYFDYDAWARDLALETTSIELPDGTVAIFHQ